jgi:hypothetical protein
VRRVGGDIHGRACADSHDVASKSEFEIAFENREHLLEIMAMRRRVAAGKHDHVDQTARLV